MLSSAKLEQVRFCSRLSQKLIPYTTHRQPALLDAVSAAEQISVAVVQAPVPGVDCGALGSTPPDAAAAKVEERTCVVTVATRKGRKAGAIV